MGFGASSIRAARQPYEVRYSTGRRNGRPIVQVVATRHGPGHPRQECMMAWGTSRRRLCEEYAGLILHAALEPDLFADAVPPHLRAGVLRALHLRRRELEAEVRMMGHRWTPPALRGQLARRWREEFMMKIVRDAIRVLSWVRVPCVPCADLD